MNQDISESLERLESFEKKYFSLAKLMLEPGKTYLFPLDLVANAIMDRALSYIFGFTTLIKCNNYLCAVPLVRLHLDNLLRFYAGYISKDPHDFASNVIDGKSIRNLKDKDGNRMTDKYLVDLISKDYKWIQNVYNETSGFVHFSHKHIFSSLKVDNIEKRTVQLSIGKQSRFIPDSSKLEAINCMIEISEILYEYLYGWTATKRNGDMPS
jgi:hypothetical protein